MLQAVTYNSKKNWLKLNAIWEDLTDIKQHFGCIYFSVNTEATNNGRWCGNVEISLIWIHGDDLNLQERVKKV